MFFSSNFSSLTRFLLFRLLIISSVKHLVLIIYKKLPIHTFRINFDHYLDFDILSLCSEVSRIFYRIVYQRVVLPGNAYLFSEMRPVVAI